MFLAIVLISIASASAKRIETICSTCIKVDSICHNASYLFDINAPFRNQVVITKLGILRADNRLYFAFEPSINDPEFFKIGHINLDNPESNGLVTSGKPVMNFCTFDIDQKNTIVYVGGSDGIFNLDSENKAVFFSSRGDMIQNILYRGNVFFVRTGENKIVEKRGSEFIIYEEYTNIKDFVVDNNNNIVFLNKTGLYLGKFKSNDTVKLSKNNYFRGLTVDLQGTVFAWWIDVIYKVVVQTELEDSRLVRIAEISNLGAITFDNGNNMLFNSGKQLFRLTATNATIC